VAENFGGVVEAIGSGGACGPAAAVGLVAPGAGDSPGFAVTQEIACVLGLEEDDATDRAGTIGVGDRPADHVDLLDEFGVDPELALRTVIRALEILPGAVDD